MECPHCSYQHGWVHGSLEKVDGERGDFYALPVKVEREGYQCNVEQKEIYACPSCGKTFIDA